MFQAIEIFCLEIIKYFYTLDKVFGVLLLGSVGFALMIIQIIKRKETKIPGVFSLLFLGAEALHFFKATYVVSSINSMLKALQAPNLPSIEPFPIIEPLFSILVAPLSTRHVYEEVIFSTLVVYLFFVARVSWAEYKKTGVILSDVSWKALFEEGQRRPNRSHSNELGSGDLANTEQIASRTRPSGKPGDTAIMVKDLRGSDGISFRSTNLVWEREERNKHILAVAKTGSGKTSAIILPILYNDCMCPDRTTIVLDSKPEMWQKLAAMTRKYNPQKRVILFNPLDKMRSLSWNILSKIEDDTDAKLIANTIIMATDNPSAKADSPFFRNNALAILNSIMVGLLHDKSDRLSMPRVHELVQSGMKSLCDWLEQHPEAIRNTRTFVELARSGSQNADTIMSELSMRLSAWDLQAIRATTYNDEIDLDDLVNHPTLFIIELRESELEMLRPMANVIVVEILRFLTKKAERCPGVTLPRPVGLVIDEFASSLGRLPDIHVKLNTLRSRNVSIVAAIQSIAQIKANYGDDADSVLAGFNSKIFMPALDLQDAEWASKESGQMTIRFKTASTGSNAKLTEWFASKNDSTQEQVQQRAVLTPDEIGRPPDNAMTFFLPRVPVFQGFIVPFYKIPDIAKRFDEFKNSGDLKLRDKPIEYLDKPPAPPAAPAAQGAQGLPAGITNTKGWTDDQIRTKLEETKKKLDWDNTTGSARKWWEAFENENKTRLALVLRLAEELANRKATITEFFLAYVYSNTDNIQANLCYLDYTRLKKEEERKKREAAQKAKEAQQGGTSAAGAAPAAAAPAAPSSASAPAEAPAKQAAA